jgi:adenine-specific DNA-methyltransferase
MPQQRLELTWIGKGEEPQLEPRILIEDPDKSYGEAGSENMLIHGDNLLALKALEQEYAGKVKCVFIDPPYNTGSAFEHYNDGVEHSLWLRLMNSRLEELRKLLSKDGTIWIVIDDNECHYLKVLCDEVFGRGNFVSSIAWRSADSSNNDSKQFSNDFNTILVYSKEPGWESYPLPRDEKSNKHYKNPDEDPNGRWFSGNVSSPNPRPNLMYDLATPSGKTISPPSNGWRWNRDRMNKMIKSGEVVYSGDESRIIKKTYLKNQKGLAPSNLWSDIDDTGHNRQAKYELKKLFPDIETSDLFKTPKPEKVVQKALMIATKPGDIVLDSFLGSGTTAGVAHKMGRKWIGVELENQAYTVCLPRLKKVVDGLDEGGITKAQNWQGGGGFKFYNLAPSLLRKDDLGQWVIDERYNADQLAAAMAKHEGYTYAPDTDRYWKQAFSTENDYLYTTTQLITPAVVDHILEQLGPEESLLICCKAYQKGAAARDPRINLHKIPSILTDRCEFGKDDYSLNIVDAPKDEDAPEFVPAGQQATRAAEAEEVRKYGKQKDMFD